MRSAVASLCLSLSLSFFASTSLAQTPGRGAAVLLRNRYTAGEHRRYAVRSTTTAPAPVGRMVTTSHADLETVSVRPDGAAVVRTRMSGLEISGGGLTPAMSRQIREGLDGMTVELTQDARGTVLSHQPPTGVSAQFRPLMDGLVQSMEQMAVQLPENPIRVGESWNQRRDLHLPLGALGTLDMNMNITYTLRAVRGPATNRQADVGVAIAIAMDHPFVIQGVPVVGSGTGTGTLTFDVDLGALRSSASHVTMNVHVNAAGRGQNVRTEADNEMRLEAPAPAAAH